MKIDLPLGDSKTIFRSCVILSDKSAVAVYQYICHFSLLPLIISHKKDHSKLIHTSQRKELLSKRSYTHYLLLLESPQLHTTVVCISIRDVEMYKEKDSSKRYFQRKTHTSTVPPNQRSINGGHTHTKPFPSKEF